MSKVVIFSALVHHTGIKYCEGFEVVANVFHLGAVMSKFVLHLACVLFETKGDYCT